MVVTAPGRQAHSIHLRINNNINIHCVKFTPRWPQQNKYPTWEKILIYALVFNSVINYSSAARIHNEKCAQ